ncbi:MAG: TetR/AcrR family transcriptional regulator [Acidimicrobiia bacterium]|nr:MAG: TetR/AcrR family transcriptional regulator [Acidimicrobiia bacterium]
MARYRTGLATRDRILDATAALLADVGPEGTTIQAICDKSDVRPGSFYNLFASKDDAIFEVLLETMRNAAARPAGTPSLDEFIDQWVRFVLDNPTAAMIYMRLGVTGAVNHTHIVDRIRHFQEKRVDYLAAALTGANAQMTVAEATPRAELVLATLNGLTIRYLVDPAFDLAAHVEVLREIATA